MEIMEQVIVQGDLSKLSEKDCVLYYKKVCDSLGLNPLTKPFDYIILNGKKVLYARKECTEQLRKIHGISIEITGRELIDDVYVVTARAKDKAGRVDESIGAINVAMLKGDAKSNAIMKAETKAKRRVTLSIAGLGMLDETEISSIPGIESVVTNNLAVSITEHFAVPIDVNTGEIKKLPGKNLASKEQVSQLKDLIKNLGTSDEKLKTWLKKAKVASLDQMESSDIQKCIDSLNSKLLMEKT